MTRHSYYFDVIYRNGITASPNRVVWVPDRPRPLLWSFPVPNFALSCHCFRHLIPSSNPNLKTNERKKCLLPTRRGEFRYTQNPACYNYHVPCIDWSFFILYIYCSVLPTSSSIYHHYPLIRSQHRMLTRTTPAYFSYHEEYIDDEYYYYFNLCSLIWPPLLIIAWSRPEQSTPTYKQQQ